MTPRRNLRLEAVLSDARPQPFENPGTIELLGKAAEVPA